MTRAEAQQVVDERNAGDATAARWFAREVAAGEWAVVKLAVPGATGIGPLTTTTETKPRPPQPDDPRPAYWRNVGGPWAG